MKVLDPIIPSLRGKLLWLFVALLLLLAAYPFLEGSGLRAAILTLLTSVVLISAVYAVSYARIPLLFGLGLGVPALVSSWITIFSPHQALLVASHVLGVAFYAFTIVSLFSFILRSQRVTRDVIYGGVSIYLLLGFGWSVLHSVVEVLQPGSYLVGPGHNPDNLLSVPDFIYYSFTTLTTLGYGDITPVASLARSLSIMEAATGVIYLAVFVARLVGLYRSESLPDG